MQRSTRLLSVAIAATTITGTAWAGSATAAPSSGSISVTSSADAGPGSLRQALLDASASGSRTIVIRNGVGEIALLTAVKYTGTGSLMIQGGGATITAAPGNNGNLVEATGGADLTLRDVTITGSLGAGLLVKVPESATKDQSLRLDKVTVSDNLLNGIYIDDCIGTDLPVQCPADATGSGVGVTLTLLQSTISGNGGLTATDIDDMDGIRVDERGNGSVNVSLIQSTISGNSADGIEVDESDEGNVDLKVRASAFLENGPQPQAIGDPEDGFDIDERGNGNVTTDLENVRAIGNYDENLDFNEEDGGDLIGRLVDATIDNARGGRGYDLEELGEGNVTAFLDRVVISNSNLDAEGKGGDGMRAEEDEEGDLTLTVANSRFTDNAGNGIDVKQVAPGIGAGTVSDSTFSGNAEPQIKKSGVTVTEINVTVTP